MLDPWVSARVGNLSNLVFCLNTIFIVVHLSERRHWEVALEPCMGLPDECIRTKSIDIESHIENKMA